MSNVKFGVIESPAFETLHAYCTSLYTKLQSTNPVLLAAAEAAFAAELQKDPGNLAEIKARIAESPTDWLGGRPNEFPLHHGWGTAVRNWLRNNGFDEATMGIDNWDDYYSILVERAVAKVIV